MDVSGSVGVNQPLTIPAGETLVINACIILTVEKTDGSIIFYNYGIIDGAGNMKVDVGHHHNLGDTQVAVTIIYA